MIRPGTPEPTAKSRPARLPHAPSRGRALSDQPRAALPPCPTPLRVPAPCGRARGSRIRVRAANWRRGHFTFRVAPQRPPSVTHGRRARRSSAPVRQSATRMPTSSTPSQRSITLKGGKAVVLLAAIALFAISKVILGRATLDSAGRQELATWLAAEYTRAAVAAVGHSAADSSAGQELLRAQDVGFRSLTAHGGGDDVVVRAEILVAGQPPPVGRQVRYFRMHHSSRRAGGTSARPRPSRTTRSCGSG